MKNLRLSAATKQVSLFFLDNPDQYYTSEPIMKMLELPYTTVHHILQKLEKACWLEGKKRKAKKGPRFRYKVTELGISKAFEIVSNALQESRHNKILREAIKAHIEQIVENRGLSKSAVAKLIADKLPADEGLPAAYLADLMSGRRNLLTSRCIALLDGLNLELEVKVVRKRARAKGEFFE